ncbi:MAG: antitoxin [Candidatus Nitrospinota bacterium M3_3B_026]
MEKTKAKVFVSGRSQAVRIPKKFRFECDEVYIEREGDRVILTPSPASWSRYFSEGKRFTEDFPDHIEDAPPPEREIL